NIAAVGTDAADRLQLTGTSTLPITFANGAGNDQVEVLGGSIAFSGDIGGAGRNVAVSVASNAAAIFNSNQHLRDLDIAASGIATLSAGGSKVLVTKDLSVLGKL